MNKKWMMKLTALVLVTIMILTACGGNGNGAAGGQAGSDAAAASSTTNAADPTAAAVTDPTTAAAEVHVTDPASQGTAAEGDFTYISTVADGITQEGSVYTITAAGTYSFSGSLSDGQIVVNAPDQKVEIVLSNAAVSCSADAPIKILDADKVTITVEGYNEVTDARAVRTEEEAAAEEKAAGGAIYAKCDLTLAGSGTLVVTGGYNNGVHTTKDLKVKEVTLKVTAPNNALKGNDSVTVESGTLLLISSGGDGIKTEDSDVSSKGNQRGTVTIAGGIVEIYAACDGIDAAYDAEISGAETVLNIYTDSYSPYTGDVLNSGTTFYLIMSETLYQSHTLFAAYYYNDDETAGVWARASYAMQVYSGRTAYAALSLTAPSGYENVAYFAFDSDATSTEAYAATTGGGAVNRSMNAVLLEDAGGSLSGDYVSLSLSGSGSSTASAKGIKADNGIVIADASVTVRSTDDAIHANNDVTLGNGAQGLGNVSVTGGTLTLSSGDDGIHGDGAVTIDGGAIHILTAYEGVEGNVVTFNGGETEIYALDDGVNAKKGAETALIAINGGVLKVTTASGDTDGLDSNGNISMTGGFVLVQSSSSMGGMSGSVDLDGTISVTGGTLVALGGICSTPNGSGDCCTVLMNGQSFAAGEYSVIDGSNVLFTFTVDSACQNGWIASDALSQGGSYQLLKDGAEVYSWTQSSQSAGSGGSGWGGSPGGGGWRR